MIDTAGRAPGRVPPKPPLDFSNPMPGPESVTVADALTPAECDRLIANYDPEMTLGGERCHIDPATSPALARKLARVAADIDQQHYRSGASWVYEAFVMRYQPGQYMREHRDNEYEGIPLAAGGGPVPRVPFALTIYLTDPADYGGGALAIGGERHRPARGTAVAVRGDVLHSVDTIEHGERFILKVAAGVPSKLSWTMLAGSWVRSFSFF